MPIYSVLHRWKSRSIHNGITENISTHTCLAAILRHNHRYLRSVHIVLQKMCIRFQIKCNLLRINWTSFCFTANLVALTQGCAIGWLSPALPQLISQKTSILSEPLNSVEVSWLGSISCLGAITGAISFCSFVGQIGPKRAVLFLSIPYSLVWLLIYVGDTITYLLCARFLVGFAGGGADILILFISEIANDKYVHSFANERRTFQLSHKCTERNAEFSESAVALEHFKCFFAIWVHWLQWCLVPTSITEFFRAFILWFQLSLLSHLHCCQTHRDFIFNVVKFK